MNIPKSMVKFFPFIKVFVIIIVCFRTGLFAQFKEISFLHLDEPISQNTVTTILEDNKGFLWFGTAYGLNRYDGAKALI